MRKLDDRHEECQKNNKAKRELHDRLAFAAATYPPQKPRYPSSSLPHSYLLVPAENYLASTNSP
jgi:hypothetical protein